jgi:anti-anti-sigma factor
MPHQLRDRPLLLSSSVHTNGPEVVLTVAGELDVATAPALTALLADAASSGRPRVVVDVRAVTFLDAAGLRALRGEPGGWSEHVTVVLREPSCRVTRLLELTDSCDLLETSASTSVSDREQRSA